MSTSGDFSGSGSGSGLANQGRKPKKRVELHTIGEDGDPAGHQDAITASTSAPFTPDAISGSALATASSDISASGSADWMLPPSGLDSPIASPALLPHQPLSRASDANQLRLALRRAFLNDVEQDSDQDQNQNQNQTQNQKRQVRQKGMGMGPGMGMGMSDAEDSPPTSTPKVLKPVFKRNTSYNGLQEQEEADKAEKKATERQVRAMTDAQQRAGRLAVSINAPRPPSSQSAPGSRRSSVERDDSFFPLPSTSSDDRGFDFMMNDDDGSGGDGYGSEMLRPDGSFRHRAPYHHHSSSSSAAAAANAPPRGRRPSEHDAAQNLVQSCGRRAIDQFYYQGSASGTSTPVMMHEYAQDYVPQPAKYRGGILSSLLKLYRDEGDADQRGGGGGRSGFSTPMTGSMPGSPLLSPVPSPPSSRCPSPPRSTTSSRSRSRLRPGLHKSSSSTTLTDLFKPSSSSAAYRSGGELSDQLLDKFKKKVSSSRPKKEKIRITVHIAGILARHKYLLKLCRALMLYGAPTHRLEEYMTMSSRVLEIEGQFLYIPSCMFISFDDSSTHTTEVKLVRVPQGVDLGRLREVHNIYKLVVHDQMHVEEATERLEEVMDRKPKFRTWFRVLMYGIASACVAPIAFQGRFVDLPIAFLLGCLVGTLQLVFAPSNELYAHVFEVSAAVITSFAARGFGSIHKGQLFCFSALAQSSIALILPGYMVLCGSLELQSYNMVSGSVRMVHALVYTLFLGYGITIGASLYGMMDKAATSTTTCPRPLNTDWNLIFVPAFTLCLCVINQAKWKQMPVMLTISLAGFVVNSYSSRYFVGSSQLSNMLGALTVGILANLYSRLGAYIESAWLDFLEWWTERRRRRHTLSSSSPSSSFMSFFSCFSRRGSTRLPDLEKAPTTKSRKKTSYNLAATAMLPAIFVQVPSGLAAGGSLLTGINTANQINSNHTMSDGGSGTSATLALDGAPLTVLFSVIQVAISLSVGLFLSALIVYPLGKRRSGLFSF